jgi:hypothetical protein
MGAPDVGIRLTHRCCANPDKHLVVSRRRLVDVFDSEDLGWSVSVLDYSSHLRIDRTTGLSVPFGRSRLTGQAYVGARALVFEPVRQLGFAPTVPSMSVRRVDLVTTDDEARDRFCLCPE